MENPKRNGENERKARERMGFKETDRVFVRETEKERSAWKPLKRKNKKERFKSMELWFVFILAHSGSIKSDVAEVAFGRSWQQL